jgi:hypothetical protein
MPPPLVYEMGLTLMLPGGAAIHENGLKPPIKGKGFIFVVRSLSMFKVGMSQVKGLEIKPLESCFRIKGPPSFEPLKRPDSG